MKQFEYLRVSDPSDEDLNNYGNSGYELVAVTTDFSGNTYIFKKCIEIDSSTINSVKDPSVAGLDYAMKFALIIYPDSKLGQVKYVKEFLNIGLKEAKDIVDDYWSKNHVCNAPSF